MSLQSTYRGLLRATKTAFQTDLKMLKSSRAQIRHAYKVDMADNNLTKEQIDEKLLHAQDVAMVLRTNVVQGEEKGEKHYKVMPHKNIEFGDNDAAEKKRNTLTGKKGEKPERKFKPCS